MDHSRQRIVATAQSCADQLDQVEREYQVSINFWLKVNKNTGGPVEIELLASGSGDVFDLVPMHHGVVRSRVLVADAGSVYPALQSCLSQLATNFDQVKGRAQLPDLP